MLVGKNTEKFHQSPLYVDSWRTEYKQVDSHNNQDYVLCEKYEGKVTMESVNQYKYLGQIISNTKDNQAHISYMKIKSISINKRIFSYLKDLKLGRYFFECGILMMNCLLRRSILYSAETLYNLNEREMREFEKIEEGYLRELVGTGQKCPISQLYLEVGQYPARFDIFKIQILFYHYIINQDEKSLIFRFLQAQKDSPTKGDWFSIVKSNMLFINFSMTDEQMKHTTKYKLKKILKEKIETKAFQYLQNMRGSKGKEIMYNKLSMSEYLLPNSYGLNIEEKKLMYNIRNRMLKNIHYNFKSTNMNTLCRSGCPILETEYHIYICPMINEKTVKNQIEFHKIYNGHISDQVKVLRKMKENLVKIGIIE